MEDWTELDELANELRQLDEARWQQVAELQKQFESLQAHVEVIGRQFSELRIDAHLQALNQRLLGGLGSVESIHSGAGIEYLAALVWPAHIAPIPTPDAPAEGVYRIEVWLGPSLEDGRARIRISGSKRLEAVLPTTNERFRTALLSVFRQPQVMSPGGDMSAGSSATEAPTGPEEPQPEPEIARGEDAEADENGDASSNA